MDATLTRLRRRYVLALAAMAALAAAPLIIRGNSDDFPFLQTLLIVLLGGASLIGIGWLRQRPIAPEDAEEYGRTFYLKVGIALAPTVLACLIAITTGPRWLALLAAAPAFAGLLLAQPSEEDAERHQLLYLS